MPEISRFYGIVIKMFFNEHNPPHFHAEYQEYSAEYDIRTMALIEGELPKRAETLVREWAERHRDELQRNWEAARAKRALNRIEPLL